MIQINIDEKEWRAFMVNIWMAIGAVSVNNSNMADGLIEMMEHIHTKSEVIKDEKNKI